MESTNTENFKPIISPFFKSSSLMKATKYQRIDVAEVPVIIQIVSKDENFSQTINLTTPRGRFNGQNVAEYVEIVFRRIEAMYFQYDDSEAYRVLYNKAFVLHKLLENDYTNDIIAVRRDDYGVPVMFNIATKGAGYVYHTFRFHQGKNDPDAPNNGVLLEELIAALVVKFKAAEHMPYNDLNMIYLTALEDLMLWYYKMSVEGDIV